MKHSVELVLHSKAKHVGIALMNNISMLKTKRKQESEDEISSAGVHV
jgi:hypothetical protein